MSESRIHERLAADLAGYRSVLDVGCGPGKYLKRIPVDRKFALEADRQYIGEVNAEGFFLGTAQEWLPKMPPRSYDAVIALDFVEHLERQESIVVMQEMQRVATRTVIVLTPDGFHPQEGANEWQRHRSGWTADELELLGFAVERWDFDYGKGDGFEKALWATWTR